MAHSEIRTKVEVGTVKHVFFSADRSKVAFLLFMFHVYLCYVVLSVPCSLVITCWVLCFSVFYVSFPYGVPGQGLNLIALIPDLCLPIY